MIERRFSSVAPTIATRSSVRASRSGLTIAGYAAVFDQPTWIGRHFREQLARGAFTDAIGRDDVRGLFNHDANRLLGRTASRTLRLSQDARGLRYEIVVNEKDPLAMSVVAQIQRGDVSGSSFAFTVDPDDERWVYEEGKTTPLRTIYRASLIDVSPVVHPAYPTTTVALHA